MAAEPAQPGRRDDGTFSTRYDQSARFELVREVALVANPARPERTTQRQWDNARATAGHPDAPTARAICMSLKMSWPELVALVFTEERDTTMSAAANQRAWFKVPTEEEIFFALRFVAMKRGGAETLSYADYERGREQLIAADKKRMGNESVLEQVLPRAGQIWNACGKDWEFALTVAQLTPQRQVKHQTSLTVDEIYDGFVRWTGARPQGWKTLDRFAQMASVPIGRRLNRKPFPQVEKAMITKRKKQGLPVPTQVMNMGEAKHLPLPDDVFACGETNGPNRPRRRKLDWTYETVLGCLAEYVRTLPAGTKASQHHYRSARKGKVWPTVQKIQDYAAWSVMLAAARKLAQTGELTRHEDLAAG